MTWRWIRDVPFYLPFRDTSFGPCRMVHRVMGLFAVIGSFTLRVVDGTYGCTLCDEAFCCRKSPRCVWLTLCNAVAEEINIQPWLCYKYSVLFHIYIYVCGGEAWQRGAAHSCIVWLNRWPTITALYGVRPQGVSNVTLGVLIHIVHMGMPRVYVACVRRRWRRINKLIITTINISMADLGRFSKLEDSSVLFGSVVVPGVRAEQKWWCPVDIAGRWRKYRTYTNQFSEKYCMSVLVSGCNFVRG